jgi:hypothetical protein
MSAELGGVDAIPRQHGLKITEMTCIKYLAQGLVPMRSSGGISFKGLHFPCGLEAQIGGF